MKRRLCYSGWFVFVAFGVLLASIWLPAPTPLKADGADPAACGTDNAYSWDFFDVPVPTLTQATGSPPGNGASVYNQVVNIGDVIAILQYIGTTATSPNVSNANGRTYG